MGKVCKACGEPVGFFGKVCHAGDFYHSSCFEQLKPGLMCPVCGDLRIPFESEGGGLGCTRCKREGRDELYFNIPPKFEAKIGRYVSHECIDTSTRDKSSTEINLKWKVLQPPEFAEKEELIDFEVPGTGFKTEALSEVRQGDIVSIVIRTDEGMPGPYHFRNLTTGLDYPLRMPISASFFKHGDHGILQIWQWKKPHSKELSAALEAATTNPQAPLSEAIRTSRMMRELVRGIMSLVKVHVVLFRSELNRLMYADRARTALGMSPGATVLGISPSDETFAKRAIEAVCGDISSLSPAPEVKMERDDGSNILFDPRTQMESYSVDFLRKKISTGEDPDYFHEPGYNVQTTLSTDRLSGDYAIVISIRKIL
jgi:hypothetical protein